MPEMPAQYYSIDLLPHRIYVRGRGRTPSMEKRMSYIATVRNAGNDWYLRGTTWTGERERAQVFTSLDRAVDACRTAKKFMKPAVYRNVEIREAVLTAEPAFVQKP